MERYWTKKRLVDLAHGDAETVRQWQSQYGRFIYTWLYFQLDKDESRAAALTAQTLSQALLNLSAFDPEQTTIYLWLKEIAAEQLQSTLARDHGKVQRPAAWSQLPARVFESLRRLRSEPVAPDVPACGAVIEMVQAALADLSEQDRDLLVRRYIRLDTLEHIASELNLSVEKVNQQLYLARHAFRRGLFYLFQSVNANAIEPAGAGGVDVFESNLETLLRSVNPAAMIQADHAEHIKRLVLQTASEVAQHPPIPAPSKRRFNTKLVAAAVVILAAGLVTAVLVMRRHSKEPVAVPQPSVPQASETQTLPSSSSSEQSPELAHSVDELQRVLEIGMRGDAAGLLEVLKSGSEIAQMAAAHYLGRVGDASAIEPLELAESRWFPNGSPDNPFALAITQIHQRLEEAMPSQPTAPESAEPTETVQQEPQAEPQTPPAVSGQVIGFDGTRLVGVEVAVRAEGQTSQGQTLTAVTDDQGRYAFDALPDGLCVVSVRDPQQRIAETHQMVWAVAGQPLTLDFGGAASIAGAVIIDDEPLAEQVLLLSDNFQNPEQGVFAAVMQTDAQGVFYCTDVPAGHYGLFARLMANRWTLLERFEADRSDVSLLIDPPAVELTVQAPELPEALEMTAVSLRYSPDSADTLAVWTGVKTEEPTVFRIHGVLPSDYTLCMDFSNGVRWMRNISVDQRAEQLFIAEEIPYGLAGLTGQFLSDWPEGLTLESADPPVRVSVMPEPDGGYVLDGLPPAMYALGATVNQLFVPYLEIGLYDDQPVVYDPDPQQLAQSRSPLYVYATDAQGRGLAGGQVWLADEVALYPAEPFERGYFAAAPPGRYTLYAVFAGYEAVGQTVELPASTLRAARDANNTVVVRLNP